MGEIFTSGGVFRKAYVTARPPSRRRLPCRLRAGQPKSPLLPEFPAYAAASPPSAASVERTLPPLHLGPFTKLGQPAAAIERANLAPRKAATSGETAAAPPSLVS